MKTFFWGYFSLKWRRLLRTISLFIFGFFFLIWLFSSPNSENYQASQFFFIVFLIVIPTLSFIIEPFVIKNDKKELVGNSENTISKVLNDKKEYKTPETQSEASIDKDITGTSIINTEHSSFTMKSNLKEIKPVIISTTADTVISKASYTEINLGNNKNINTDTKKQLSLKKIFKFDNEYLTGWMFLIRFLIVCISLFLFYIVGLLSIIQKYFLTGGQEYATFFIFWFIAVLSLFFPLLPTFYKRSISVGFSKAGSIFITFYFLILPSISMMLYGADFVNREILIFIINSPILFLIFADGKKGDSI